jgi:hypothetical protein
VLEPGLDVEVEQVRAVGEPALALGGESQEDVLEAAKGALAVDGDEQPFPQRGLRHRGHETFHPAVLLARRGRVDPQVAVGVVRHLRAAGGRVRLAFDDREEVAVLQVEETFLVRRITFESDLEIAPVHGDRRHGGSLWPSSHGKRRKS